jgi:hypothetical protein
LHEIFGVGLIANNTQAGIVNLEIILPVNLNLRLLPACFATFNK